MSPVLNNASTHVPNSIEEIVRGQPTKWNAISNEEVYNAEEQKFGEDKLEDNIDRSLMLNHQLHGCITDDGYDPSSMEEGVF